MQTKSIEKNPLRDLFYGFSESTTKFREKVCEECNWSPSTFYRKIREDVRPDPNRPGKMIKIFSPAEKIKDLAWEIQQELKDRL
ncbi:hypothetical protein CLV51_10114 [Chitinophaga niastensis]|uniref:Uncharacterized protein n=1 Tax=Chitinophaga niastensis TaxID=536980 RepID=A0A2P8HR51_CHINA|nr:hypothetical protein [Chitinophaga niastensis]PSL48690.1 hypothetical protein CLV51_10114 [Chitinophaga niastensis]